MEIIQTNFDYRPMTPRNVDNVDLIILHHTACEYATPEEIHQWHLNNGWAGIGYNFYVRKDGTIYSCRPMEYVPAHCSGYNTRSIGVCFEGNFEYEWMNDTQINSGREIVAYLKSTYGIDNVGKHKDYNATDCPGANFPFDEIVSGEPTPPTPPPEFDPVVLDYQQSWNKTYGDTYGRIEEDGIYGPETENSKRKVYLKYGMKNNLIGWCQCRLKYHKGYDLGTSGINHDGVDDCFGDTTREVVGEFQYDNGLDQDFVIGYDTISLLF